jgi:hypothetical protein
MERSVSGLTAVALSVLAGATTAHALEAGAGRGMAMDLWSGPAPEVVPIAVEAPAPAGQVGLPRGLAAAIMATMSDPTLDVDLTVAACYDAENPPSQEVIDWLEMNLYRGGQDYQNNSRWPGSQGDPVNLSWSFCPDGMSIPNGIGEGTGTNEIFSRLDSLFSAQGGRATWINRFQMVMDRWQELSGINYTRVKFNGNDWDDGASWSSNGSPNARGDIRICMKPIDGGNGILAYNFFPGNGSGGNMVLDRQENWASANNTNRFMRNIISHENGHGIGINHVCPANQSKLMEPFISTAYDGPRHDDVRAVQRHYGDPYEKDDTTVAATDLGTLAPGSITRPSDVPGASIPFGSICSIDANGENDYFEFTLGGPAQLILNVDPVGHTYQQGPQQGNCNTGNNYNSLAVADLSLQIVASNGIDVIAQALNNPVGQGESLTVNLSGGTYFARVFENNSPSQSQLYSIEFEISESERAYMGFVNAAAVPGVGTVQNDDIVSYDPGSDTWSMIFDGSDVGLATAAIDGFTILPGGQNLMLFSFKDPAVIPGLIGGPDGENVDDSDIVQFVPITLGQNTSGSFLFYFDGSDVGLTTNAEDINAIATNTNGKLVISTFGNATGTGATWVRQDLVEFTGQTGGNTVGTFAMLFDGSDVGLTETTENIDGAAIRTDGSFMLTTTAAFSVNGAAGTGQDLLQFTPIFLGGTTSGIYELFLDLSTVGIDATENVIGLTMTAEGPQGDIPSCPADLNSDESLDLFDFLIFQSLFASGDLDADFDADGVLTVFDFFAFQNLYIAGC